MPRGDRLPRLLKLIQTIQNQPGLSAEELARESGIGIRQIFRDLQVLQYAGVPLYNEGGYRLTENFLLQEISFSLDEALSLLYGLKLVERQKALFPIRQVKERLLGLLPRELREGLADLDPHVDVAEGPAADYAGKGELFHILNQAMRESRSVEIDYYTFGRDEVGQRAIDPHHMVYKDGFWYLVGFCHWRGEERLFRVDRIRHIHLLKERFTVPKDAQRPHWNTAWGMELGEEYEFRVRFSGDAARFVRETQFHPHQKVEEEKTEDRRQKTEDGGKLDSVVFTARAYGLKSVARWVLSFGGEAEVLEPKELREMVKEELEKAGERYQL